MSWLSWLTVVLAAVSLFYIGLQKLPDKVINSLFGSMSVVRRPGLVGWADTVIVLGLIINGLAGPLIVLVLALVDGFVYGWRPTNLAIPLPALVLQLALWRWFGDDIFVAGEKAHLLDGRYDE